MMFFAVYDMLELMIVQRQKKQATVILKTKRFDDINSAVIISTVQLCTVLLTLLMMTAESMLSKRSGVRLLWSEMGVYRDNLSAIVIGDNFLSIIVIAQNSLDLSITVIAFVIYFVIADKLSR